eukprot:1323124-Amorphochlora_amoeboformis.AAC.1
MHFWSVVYTHSNPARARWDVYDLLSPSLPPSILQFQIMKYNSRISEAIGVSCENNFSKYYVDTSGGGVKVGGNDDPTC